MNEHIVERHGVEIDLSYEHSTVCPRCARNGRDTSGDNFHVYGLDKNGKHLGGYCWCCEYTIPSEQWLEENGDVVVEEDPVGKEFNNEIHEEIKKRTKVDGNNFRGIKKETSIYFGVRYDVNEDKSIKEVYYPVTKNYELSGYKVRIVPKDFTSYGETGKDCDLFGQFRFKNSTAKYCIITSGEQDQLAAFQMLKEYNDSRGGDYEPTPVVSSTIGESGSHKQIQNQYEWFNRFEKIILCYDMDDAGFSAVDKVAKVLPKGKVFVMQLPMKDASDMLKAGKQKEFINCFFKATAYVPSGIVGSGNLLDKIREAEKVQKIPLPPFMHNVQDLMAGGIPLKKIVNLGSASGTGKSTIIDEMVYYWIFNSPHLCGVVTLESDCAEYGKKLLSRHIGKKIDLISDYDKKQEFLASPEVESAARDLFYFRDGTHRFHLVEERDGSIEDIKNLIMQLIIQCECKIIILDPLQDVLDGMNIDEQSVFMKWMKGATKSHDVTFINVNHVRKSGSGQTANSAGADLHEEDFQGSSSIFKSGACNLLFTRNKEHESPIMRNVTKMKMTKCRWSGKTSPKAGMFYYDNESHTLHDLDDWLTMHPEAAKEID